MRLLFVDDEESILEGLEDRLQGVRPEWDMTFAVGSARALSCLEQERFDVIVTDMRMPGMDGAELLRRVRSEHGHMVRLILSGQTDKEAVLRSLPIAHQVLAKPCATQDLLAAIERACALHELLSDERVRALVASVDHVPVAPALHHELRLALGNPGVSLAKLGGIIEQDPSLTARLLRIVNSAYFAVNRKLSRAADAVSYLGLETVSSLILSIELFDKGASRKHDVGMDLDELQRHSLLTGRIAARIVEVDEQRSVAFSAAVLHDVGKLVLATAPHDYYEPVRALAGREGIAEESAEQRIYGFTHAEVGAYLLALWGLPYPIVEAVAHHHQPSRATSTAFGAIDAVHVANHWAGELGAPSGRPRVAAELDATLVRRAGEARVASWREHAEQIVAGVAA